MLPNLVILEPEPEETLHSVLITGWRLSAYQSFPQFTRAIFKHVSDGRGWSWDYRRICPYFDPCRATGWALLHKTLLLPYLVPFMPPEVARAAPRRVDGDRRIIGGDTDLYWRHYLASPLKYCPRCVQLQMSRFHRSMWLRPHQLDRVDVCWRHSIKLVSVRPHPSKPLFPNECEDQAISYSHDRSAIWLARQSNELLTGNHPPSDPKVRQHIYQERAARIGYGRGTRIDFRLIAVHLLQTFGSSFFKRMMGNCDVKHIATYMRLTILGDDPSIRPINQLLCIQALFGEQRHFFERVRAASTTTSCRTSDSDRRNEASQSAVHRNIFLEQLKSSGQEVMTHLSKRYPLSHEWIVQNALAWSRRKIAEQVQGPDRARVLRLRAADLLAKAKREREELRRSMSPDKGYPFGSVDSAESLKKSAAVDMDFHEVAAQLNTFSNKSLQPSEHEL